MPGKNCILHELYDQYQLASAAVGQAKRRLAGNKQALKTHAGKKPQIRLPSERRGA